MNRRQPWPELAQDLVAVAMGRKPATLVIKNGRWVNVHSGEIIPHTDVAVYKSRIAYVGEDAGHAIGEETKVIEADGRYLIPGLCDAHMHVESGMVTVTEFVRAVIPHGSTSLFIDPHEIANVLGLDGVRLMHDEAQTMPINVYVQMPSYREHMGFQHQVMQDLRFAYQFLHRRLPDCKVVVYIDDLDRCSEEKIMELLQAINLILANSRFFVLVGMDTEMIYRAIVSHYASAFEGIDIRGVVVGNYHQMAVCVGV